METARMFGERQDRTKKALNIHSDHLDRSGDILMRVAAMEFEQLHDSALVESVVEGKNIAFCFELSSTAEVPETRFIRASGTNTALVAVGRPMIDNAQDVLFSVDFDRWARSLDEDSVDVLSVSVDRDQLGRCLLEIYGATNDQVRILIICEQVSLDRE